MLVKLLITSAFLMVLVAVKSSSGQTIGKCGSIESKKLDEIISRVVIVGNPNATFPSNLIEATKWCSDAKDSVHYIRDFSKRCLESLPRQVSSLIAYGVSKHQKKMCKSPKLRADLGSKLNCVNGNYESVNRQMELYIDDYQRTIEIQNSKAKITGLCCSFHAFAAKIRVEVEKTCSPDQTKYFMAFIRGFSSDAIDMLCANYSPDDDACKNLKFPAKDPTMSRNLSFLPPLIASLATLWTSSRRILHWDKQQWYAISLIRKCSNRLNHHHIECVYKYCNKGYDVLKEKKRGSLTWSNLFKDEVIDCKVLLFRNILLFSSLRTVTWCW